MKEKKNKIYILYRIYVPTAIILWNLEAFKQLSNTNVDFNFYLIIVAIPAIFMVLNLCCFRFNYSIFGKYERTVSIDRTIIAKLNSSWGRIGRMYATIPFFSWYLYQNGIGFSCLGIGRGFIALRDILEVNNIGLSSVRIKHSSKEIRTPIYIPKSIGIQLKNIKENEI